MNDHELKPKRWAWLLIAMVFVIAAALWSWSQGAVCASCLPPQFFQHAHPTEAEHATEKYE